MKRPIRKESKALQQTTDAQVTTMEKRIDMIMWMHTWHDNYDAYTDIGFKLFNYTKI
jgi:hypothetical protein